jgi:hypothetical protein
VTRPALLIAAAMTGCDPAPLPTVPLPSMALDHPAAPSDAGAPPGRCPPDAPWNGRVCLGMGYVACPGEKRMDDAGVCASGPNEPAPRDAVRDR